VLWTGRPCCGSPLPSSGPQRRGGGSAGATEKDREPSDRRSRESEGSLEKDRDELTGKGRMVLKY